MAFNFPDPAVSTTATNPVTGAKYQWKADPGKWVLTGGPADAANPPVTIDLLPPEDPQKGDLWIHEESLIEYAWDGTQWFEVGSSCGGGSEGDEEEEELYHPFVNSYKLVAPDDYTGKEGTATILTNAYDAGDDSYLSPVVNTVKFAAIDLNGRKHESAIVGDTIQLTPENKKEGSSNTLYGALEVTTVAPSGNSTRYDVDFDGSRSVIYIEGDIVHYRIAPVEEPPYQPFVNRYKLVDPDDYTADPGTATIKTEAYFTGSPNFVSPTVQEVYLAYSDLDGRKYQEVLDGESFDLAPETLSSNEETFGSYINNRRIGVSDYAVETKAYVYFTEGDIIYFRKTSSDLFVRKEGGDTMEGPLVVSGPRKAGDDPDQPKLESTINVLNVENRLGSYLGLKHNGTTKVYLGATDVSIANDIKFNRSQGSFISSNVQEVLKVNDRNVAYLGQIIEDDSLVTKEYVDTADEELRQDILELEQEIDAIAPSVERGEWLYSDTGIASAAGSYSMNTDTFDAGLGDPADIFAAVENIVINEKDQSGTIHSFANVEVGQLIEIFEANDSDYGLYKILDVMKMVNGGGGVIPGYTFWSFDVSLVSTGQGDKASGVARFKIFSPPSGGTADGFVLKTGDKMSGTLRLPILQGYRPADDIDAFPRINLDNNIYGATMEWGPNRLRIAWNETGGSLYTGYGSSAEAALKWTRSNVNDGNTSQVLYYGAITEPKNLVHKEYVDDQIAELLAKIEELEMSAGTPTSYSFSMQTKKFGSSSSIGGYINGNQICSCDNDGSSWNAYNTYAFSADRKSIYICLQDGYQLNSTGYMQVIKNNGSTQYNRTDNVATFAISEVEVCPPDKANNRNIYRAKVQVDAFKDTSTHFLPSWSDGDSLHITFTGGSVTKVS
jgi:hypothetical protein